MAFLTSGKSPRKKSRVPGHRLHFPFSKTEKICHAQPRRRPQKVCRKNHFYNLIAKKQRIVFSTPSPLPFDPLTAPLRVAAKKLRAIGWGWVLRNKFFNEFPLFCQRPESLTAAQQRCLNQLGALPPAPCERAQQVFQVFLATNFTRTTFGLRKQAVHTKQTTMSREGRHIESRSAEFLV